MSDSAKVVPYVYVASSWRNKDQPVALSILRQCGCEVYDFRGGPAFIWGHILPATPTLQVFREALGHQIAAEAYRADRAALDRATHGLLVQPGGRSAHLEIGYLVGRGIPTAVWYPDSQVEHLELMLKMCDTLLCGDEELREWASAGREAHNRGVMCVCEHLVASHYNHQGDCHVAGCPCGFARPTGGYR